MIVVKGGVTAPIGFVANGVKAGIKKSGNKDLALLYSEVPAVAEGAFTTNRCKASPVKVSQAHLKGKIHQAIIVNSGNANCANGKIGDKDAVKMAVSRLRQDFGKTLRARIARTVGGEAEVEEELRQLLAVFAE